MDFANAKHVLLQHGGVISVPLESDTFLSVLRPFKRLPAKEFEEIMLALIILGETISADASIDRKLIGSVLSVCITGRNIGVYPNSPLVRNKIISQTESSILSDWIDTIEVAFFSIIRGVSDGPAMNYAVYISRKGEPPFDPYAFEPFFTPLIDDDESNVREIGASALAVLLPVCSKCKIPLTQLSRDPDSDVRLIAIKALGDAEARA